MNVFVAGGTGVIGRPAVAALVAAGHRVSAVARGEEKARLLHSLGAEPVAVDLFDPAALREAVAGSDAVLRLATHIPAPPRMLFRRAWAENDRLRRDGARNLVDAALSTGVRRYLQESVTFLYPDSGDRWIDEQTPATPASESLWQLQSVLDAESEAERFSAAGGRALTLRFSMLYAPGASSTESMLRLARYRLVPVIGAGVNYIASIHADDAASAVVHALDAPAGVYNISDDEPLLQRDYLSTLSRAAGGRPPTGIPVSLARLLLRDATAIFIRSQRIANGRFKQATGWRPRYPSLREGLAALVATKAV